MERLEGRGPPAKLSSGTQDREPFEERTMVTRAQVAIIGAGVIGASIAYHLALRGCPDVLILEKEEAEVSGSTARSAAGVRHQFSNATNILLSRYSIQKLR
jgi:sarcosine oxidase subunit beta